MGPANVPDRAASGGQADEDRLDDLDVQEESAAIRCHIAAALVRDGRLSRALWLSAPYGVVTTGRLESECEAHLPTVQRGAVDRAHQAVSQDGSSSARNPGHSSGSERVLEHGFYERQAGGWAIIPDSDRGGPVHAGVRLSGSRPSYDGDACGASVGESEVGEGKIASQHYRGQRQRVLQSCLGSVGDGP